MEVAATLDTLRHIAYEGRTFATNPYDLERYELLASIVTDCYEALSGIERSEIDGRFRRDLGCITAKVGVDAIICGSDERILAHLRTDDGLWSLPGGWVNSHETPSEAIAREVEEETGLKVRVDTILNITFRRPTIPSTPHSSCHILFGCSRVAGDLVCSHESLELGFVDPNKKLEWHADHLARIQDAIQLPPSDRSIIAKQVIELWNPNSRDVQLTDRSSHQFNR